MLSCRQFLLAILLAQLFWMIQGTDHNAGGVDPNPAVPPEIDPWLHRRRHLTAMVPDHAEDVDPDLHPFLQRRRLPVVADITGANDQPPEQRHRNLLRRRKDDVESRRRRRRARADDENRNLLRRRKSIDRKLVVAEHASPYKTENADEQETV